MRKATLRIYDEEIMRVLRRRSKALMDGGMTVSDAFGRVHDAIENKEEPYRMDLAAMR